MIMPLRRIKITCPQVAPAFLLLFETGTCRFEDSNEINIGIIVSTTEKIKTCNEQIPIIAGRLWQQEVVIRDMFALVFQIMSALPLLIRTF